MERGGSDGAAACVVLCTAPDLAVARSLARAVVEARAAACVNLVPGATSVYRWEGAVQEEAEVLLVLKTTRAALAELERLVRERHPYETPEWIVLEPAGVGRAYLAWLVEQCASA